MCPCVSHPVCPCVSHPVCPCVSHPVCRCHVVTGTCPPRSLVPPPRVCVLSLASGTIASGEWYYCLWRVVLLPLTSGSTASGTIASGPNARTARAPSACCSSSTRAAQYC
eukprot:2587786-Rhodomonas_salina.1